MFIGLSIAVRYQLGPDLPWLQVELPFWTIGLPVTFWGWSSLRRAKASRPDLTWWQFLKTDLPPLGLVALIVALVAIPSELREELIRSLQELTNSVNIARGRP
jgi:hypothetical protein